MLRNCGNQNRSDMIRLSFEKEMLVSNTREWQHATTDYLLVVEDTASDICLLEYCLHMHGFQGEVRVCTYGFDVRNLFLELIQNPPLVILIDSNLPDMAGIEMLREIKSHQQLKEIPMIVWTGQRVENEQEESYQLGVMEYFEKPLDINTLIEFAGRIAQYWNLRKNNN